MRSFQFAATRLDGLLLAYGHGDPQLADELAAVGASVVFAGRMPFRGPAEHTTWVDSDSVGGAQAGVQHLVDGGRALDVRVRPTEALGLQGDQPLAGQFVAVQVGGVQVNRLAVAVQLAHLRLEGGGERQQVE